MDHHWFIAFDNVSELEDWRSDMLCRAVTGSGMQTRRLYSDDDAIVRSYQRCIAINGINVVATKPDLLDRSLLFQLPRVDEKDRD